MIEKTLPFAAVTVYWISLWKLQGLRGDHFAIGLALVGLQHTNRVIHRLRKFFLPFLLTAVIYDSQRFYADYIRGPIHVAEPYLLEKYFFGINTVQGILTLNEWWQLHLHPVLDLVAGLAYLTFIPVYLGITAYFYFFLSKAGTQKCPAALLARKTPRTTWSFFWVNILGYSTYYWYAAAPPWYVAKYGLGPARLDVPPDLAGCARFDNLLGTTFFSHMYGRSADVFGAIPSLHVAYPLLAVYYAFQFGAAQAVSLGFYLLMCFSAVYLNHHYVLDVVAGSAYAILTAYGLDKFLNWKANGARI